ncbi:MAG: hypothetical protein IM613_17420 [Cytophagales bacterium]|nr:hypothetical protein [Cytophagales bacterium]
MKYQIEITKESGEVVHTESHPTELIAQESFDQIETIRHPKTYKGMAINLSEYPESRIGSVRLVVIDGRGNRFVRRELYRRP